MKKDKLFLNLYLIAAIVHIYAVAAGMQQAETISKYLLMPMLALHVVFNANKKISAVLLLLIALVFSWFGDLFLLYLDRNENYFLCGLASFLIVQLLYIFSFRKYRFANPQTHQRTFWWVLVPVYSVGLMIYLLPHLGDMRIPVIIYAVVITIMGITSLLRAGRTSGYSFSFVVSGAFLFIISDSMIAVNRFAHAFTNADLLVTITYVIAQYLIVTGCLLHVKEAD